MSAVQQALKLEIKQWEREFRDREGRNPSKEDIKKDTSIATKYKLYNSTKIKAAKPPIKEKSHKSRPEPLTPSKKVNKSFMTPRKGKRAQHGHSAHLNTPETTSPPAPPSPMVTELGPTPQLNGRVLSIFDAVTAVVEATPTKKASEGATVDEFRTPTKKRLDFSRVTSDGEEDPLDFSDSLPSSPDSTILDDDLLRRSSRRLSDSHLLGVPEFKTPIKNSVSQSHIQETPAYLKTSTLQTVTCSPSPLASQRIKKGLSQLIAELQDIQEDLKYGDYDEEELIPDVLASESEEDEGDAKDEIELTEDKGKAAWKKKKRKGPKRQHRLVRIRALPITADANVIDEEKDLKQQLTEIIEKKDDDEGLESDVSEEFSDDPDEYVRKNIDFSKMKGRGKPGGVSRNFKAYKIQKSKFFGKRSKGW